jgi:hypothetical protein
MSTTSKVLTLLILGALAVLVITHPAGFAADALSGGKVLDSTLAIESGQGVSSGTHGTFSLGGGQGFSVS